MSEPEQGAAATKPTGLEAAHKPRVCPICQAPTAEKYRPFCSRRCADVDLSRWLTGRYAIAGGDADEDEDGDQARAADLTQTGRGGEEI